MKKFLLLIITAANLLLANSQITFNRNYKGTWYYHANGIVQTPDGGYVFTGRDDSDMFLVGALTPGGKMKWVKNYGGDYVSVGRYIIAASDGNYVASGDWGNNSEKSVAIVKFDASGNIKFQRHFRGTEDLWGYTLSEATDGYIIGAYCSPAVGYELKLYKFNKTTGDSISCKTYKYPYYMIFNEMKKLSDNNFLLVGSRNDSICMFKINNACDSVWAKAIVSNYTAYSFTETPDHGFMMGTDGAIVKASSTGAYQWMVDQTEWGYSWSYLMKFFEVVPTLDGNYALAGIWDPDYPWAFVAKFSPTGDSLWTKAFYTDVSWQEAWFIQPTKDSGFVVCGDQYDTASTFTWYDMNFMKLDKNGDIYHVDTPSVCLVTIDPATDYNRIVWERPKAKGINFYAVCRKEGLQWKTLKDVDYDSLSVYKDVTSQTQSFHYKYCVMAVNYNEDTIRSPYFETMLLLASKGTSGNANLSWNPYLDESEKFIPAYYYIYKGKTRTSLTLLDSISGDTKSPSYIDTKYDGTNVYYQVGFKKPALCSPAVLKAEAGPYSQSLSNIIEYKASGIIAGKEITASVYPNPFSGYLTVEYTNKNDNDVRIELTDITGKIIAQQLNAGQEAGTHVYQLNTESLNGGIYLVKITSGDDVLIIKSICTK